jgi:TonB-linked SusC/RagA family outer membrane protein
MKKLTSLEKYAESIVRHASARRLLHIYSFLFLLTFGAPQVFAQDNEIVVKGMVRDDVEAKAGITVTVKAANRNAVQTDANGNYMIKAPSNGTLVFSGVGYRSQEVDVRGETVINITLEKDAAELQGVAVVAYGQQKKKNVVGAVSSVAVKDLKVATPRSLNNALAGRVSGVLAVQRSGEPGNDDAQFWIRGVSTFGAGSNPLVIVDGVERPLNNIEPEDIESFSVLKDAAATAVYGIRGANGVIVVNTKRGANNKPVINFKYEHITKGATRWPEFLGAPEFMELYNEAELATNPNRAAPRFSQDQIDKTRSGADPYLYPNVNWMDLMVNKAAPSDRATMNISGGNQGAKYYISGSYLTENGLWREDNLNAYNTNTKLKRYNFRANTDVKVNKSTDVALGLGGYLVTVNYPGTSSDQLWNRIWTTNPIVFAPYYPNPENPEEKFFGSAVDRNIRNPYHDLVNRGFQTTWNSAIQSDVTLKHNLSYLVPGLRLRGMFSFDTYNYNNINRTRDWGTSYQVSGRDAQGNLVFTSRPGQQDLNFSKAAGGNRRVYSQFDLTYEKNMGDHSLNALLLYNQQDYVNGDATNNIASLPFRYQGFVGRASYGFKNRYFAEVSAGYNGSENFEKGSRFGLFPAVALGWVVSDEAFFQNLIPRTAVEFLKFRGSLGEKGNDQIGGRRFAYLTTVGGGNGGWSFGQDFNNNIGGRGEDQWGNDLTWEREVEVNVGLETRFLRGFTLQADFFNRHRRNIFVQRSSLPLTFGVTSTPWGNIGEMKNKGFDASLEYRKKITSALDIAFRGNITYAKNEIIENDQPDYLYLYQNRKGKRLNQPFGLVATGLYAETDFIDVERNVLSPALPAPSYGVVRPGDIKYRDINGDGVINVNDEVAIGDPADPALIYGFGMSIGFKNFDISAFFQGAGMMDYMLSGQGWTPFLDGINTNLLTVVQDRWTPENSKVDGSQPLFPRLSVGANQNNTRNSTWWQRDADYLRLKTAEIGYTVPNRITSRWKIGGIRVYASGLNLLTWSDFDFWDPELGNGLTGGTGAKYPIQRTFNFGVNVNF